MSEPLPSKHRVVGGNAANRGSVLSVCEAWSGCVACMTAELILSLAFWGQKVGRRLEMEASESSSGKKVSKHCNELMEEIQVDQSVGL